MTNDAIVVREQLLVEDSMHWGFPDPSVAGPQFDKIIPPILRNSAPLIAVVGSQTQKTPVAVRRNG